MGKVEEEEPEGEAVVGPSGEATVHSSGITPPLLSFPLLLIYVYIYIFLQHTLAAHFTLEFSPFFLADESTDEEISRPKLRKRRMLTLCTVGFQWGFPVCPEERALGLLLEVSLFSSLPPFFVCGFLLLFTFLPLYFSFFRGWIY